MDLPIEAKEYLLIMAAYAVGCFTSGYYLVRWRTGRDVRSAGSGSVGATNVGRMLGRSGFAGTFMFDCLKGAAVVWFANHLRLDPRTVVLMMIAVVIGHLYPLQLRFQGGKGVATSLGVLFSYDYLIVLALAGIFLILWIPLRNLVLAGLAAFAVLPIFLYFLHFSNFSIWGAVILAVLLLTAHHQNIAEEIRRFAARKKSVGSRHGAREE